MKALKILGTIVGLLALSVFVFWCGWMRAPSPEAVCEHMSSLLDKEVGAKLEGDDMADCVRRMQPPEFGRIPYAERMKCIMDAENIDAYDKCK